MSEKASKYFTRTFKILQDTVVCSISEAISISEVWSLHVLPASLWSHSRYSGFLQQFFLGLRWIGNPKLSIVRIAVCLSMLPLTDDSWDRLQVPPVGLSAIESWFSKLIAHPWWSLPTFPPAHLFPKLIVGVHPIPTDNSGCLPRS